MPSARPHASHHHTWMAWLLCSLMLVAAAPDDCAAANLEIATFSVDITPPVGHPLLGGLRTPAAKVLDPLSAKGLVLWGLDKPVVLIAVDWCEIRNEAYDQWRDALAKAAETEPVRIMLTSVHQHDTPLGDLAGQRKLDEHGLAGAMIDPTYYRLTVEKTAAAVKEASSRRRSITHLGLGQAKVERIASNRRLVWPDGKVNYGRYSFSRGAVPQNAPDGTIDPVLKTISFWAGDEPLAAVSCYATHPMSYYGRGEISADFVGLARDRRQQEDPKVLQIYLTGCSGDVTAGKYNEGTPQSRIELTDRLYQGMQQAWKETRKLPVEKVQFRSSELRLPAWDKADLTTEGLGKILADDKAMRTTRITAALGWGWRKRLEAGKPIDVPCLDFGPAQLLVMPGETFVGYQLAAQQLRPDSFVMVSGFGESAPGYIPTDAARDEGFSEEHGWCWVAPGVEKLMIEAMRKVLLPGDGK